MKRYALALSFFSGIAFTLLTSSAIRLTGQVVFPDAEPKVQPIRFFGDGDSHNFGVQQLDSLSCSRCIFNGPLLTYGGGATKVLKSKFSPNAEVEFKAAALNTITVLEAIGYPVPQSHPGRVKIKNPGEVSFEALNGLQQSPR